MKTFANKGGILKKVTARKIARMLGVSGSTVSRALNNSSSVASDTRKMILETARKMGFSLPHTQNQTIAVIGDFFPQDVTGYYSLFYFIYDEIARRGGHVELVAAKDIELLNERIFHGAVNYSTSILDFSLKWKEAYNIPLVNINQFISDADTGQVVMDTQAAMYDAIECLVRHGHRKIAYLSLESEMAERQKGCRRLYNYEAAMRAHGFDDLTDLIFFDAENVLEETISRILEKNITGVVMPTEISGIRLEAILHRNHIRIPETLSLVTWEYPLISAVLTPPRTTIAIDYHEIAEKAVSMLYEMLSRQSPPRTVFVSAKFIERESIQSISASERASVIQAGSTFVQRRILAALLERPMSRRELAEYLKLSPANGNFRKCLGKLLKMNMIALTDPHSVHSRNQKYSLVEPGSRGASPQACQQ